MNRPCSRVMTESIFILVFGVIYFWEYIGWVADISTCCSLRVQVSLHIIFIAFSDVNWSWVYIHTSTLRYSTLLYATLRYSTLLYATLCYSTLLYATLRYSTLLYTTLRYSTLLYATLRYSALLYSTLLYLVILIIVLLQGVHLLIAF
jgi:uncharacterized protein YjbI with pentapeptide repeats